jgi:hypothetical protein
VKRNASNPESTHSPQLKNTLNKSIELSLLCPAPAPAITGLGRKAWQAVRGLGGITVIFKESYLKFLNSEKEPSPQLAA